MKKTMRAVIFHGPNDLRLENVEIPKPGEGEVLLKVGVALTCGTDFKAFRQGHPVLLNNRLPSPFGHEVSGIISAVGKNVPTFRQGQRVAAANSAPCDQCFYCGKGLPNLCEHLQLLNGAYAEYLLVPKQIVKHNLYEIPAAMELTTAALAEPVACVARALELLDLKPAQDLAILGCGLMGNIFVQLAKRKGAQVIAIGRSHEKLEQAKSFGADHVFSVLDRGDVLQQALSATPQGRGFDAVVEAIGQPQTWKQAVQLARKGGVVCLYGGCAKGSHFELDTHRVHYQELKIFGVFHHTPRHFKQALEFLSKGELDAERFISGEISLEDIPQHFRSHTDKPFAKVAVIP